MTHSSTRRDFLAAAAAGVAGLGAVSAGLAAEKSEKKTAKKSAAASNKSIANEICCFVKPLQSLSYDQLCDELASIGFQGIEGTVRAKGYIEPAVAERELPKLMDALRKRQLNMTIMTTDINEANAENEKLLRLAASLGVKRYRMAPIYYELDKPIWEQVKALKPRFQALADMNRQVGVQGLYQNHSGAKYVGAPIWDLHESLSSVDTNHLGIAFDILHATIEGGYSWPIEFNLMRPYMGAAFLKDFVPSEGKRKFETAPLGTGRVDPNYGKMLMKSGFTGPISLHKEYGMTDPMDKQLPELRKDFATLKQWLTA